MTRLNARMLSTLVVVLVAAGLQLAYWTSVVLTADSYIIEHDGLMWRTSPPGSLFPWPRGSGMLQALSPVNGTDQVIYFMARSNLHLLLSITLTIAIGIVSYLIGAVLFR